MEPTAESLFSNPPLYDALLGGYQADLRLWERLTRDAGGHVLELCAGDGRVSLPLARAGMHVAAVEREEAMVTAGRAQARAGGLAVEYHQADARRFSLGRRFPLVLLPYYSLEAFHTREDQAELLGRVREHLHPGGRFAFEVHNPRLELLNRPAGERWAIQLPHDEALPGAMDGEEECHWDQVRQVYRVQWTLRQQGEDLGVWELALRMYFPQELEALLERHGFEMLSRWGDYEGGAFETRDWRQVVICRMR